MTIIVLLLMAAVHHGGWIEGVEILLIWAPIGLMVGLVLDLLTQRGG